MLLYICLLGSHGMVLANTYVSKPDSPSPKLLYTYVSLTRTSGSEALGPYREGLILHSFFLKYAKLLNIVAISGLTCLSLFSILLVI